MRRAQQIRSDARSLYGGDISPNRNVGFADFNVDGDSGTVIGVSGDAVRSGTLGMPASTVFSAEPGSASDSEAKIFEHFASQFGDDAEGVINLFTEREPCESCYGVMAQFANNYPGIQIQYNWYLPRGLHFVNYM